MALVVPNQFTLFSLGCLGHLSLLAVCTILLTFAASSITQNHGVVSFWQ